MCVYVCVCVCVCVFCYSDLFFAFLCACCSLALLPPRYMQNNNDGFARLKV